MCGYPDAPEYLTEIARALAEELDAAKPSGPASVAKELRATLALIAASAPGEVSKVDDLASRRAARRAGTPDSDVPPVSGERGS